MSTIIKTFHIDSCPLCSSLNLKLWTLAKDRLHETSPQEFIYKKCNNCKTIFLAERPDEEDIVHFYPSDDYGPYKGGIAKGNESKIANKDKPLLAKVIKNSLYILSQIINPLFKSTYSKIFENEMNTFYIENNKTKFLDFGCGSEKFLNEARNKGWQTVGMDFSPQTIHKILENNHEGILYSNDSAWNLLKDESFDVIRLNHVIEHLYDPRKVLSQLYKKLKKGGRIHLATPNSGSVTANIFKKFWRGLECPRHIIIYNNQSFNNILNEIGFKKINIYHEIITKDFVRSLGYYEHEKGWIAHDQIESKLMDSKWTNILFIPSIIFAKLKKSDRIHAFAIK